MGNINFYEEKNTNGQKTKRHKLRAKSRFRRTHYKQRLTVLCPTADEVVGQFCILQLACHLSSQKDKKVYESLHEYMIDGLDEKLVVICV
ncbi:hypothetical protein [Fischerella thermalis]|uniref:hypothetical protein n=1 Tax=Fischerella thermalis TaxID=372787 RepID=UPI0011AEF838|nr:hypothetical protein [Fischerella thermalis]